MKIYRFFVVRITQLIVASYVATTHNDNIHFRVLLRSSCVQDPAAYILHSGVYLL